MRVPLVVGGAVAVIAIILSITGTYLVPNYIRANIDEQAWLGEVSNGTYTNTTNKWIEPDYSFSLNVWTFSVQNPSDVIHNPNAKPILVEKGPYAFREHQKKDVEFTNNGTRVLYKNNRFYYFSQQLSCPSCFLTDQVVVPNIVLQNLLDASKNNVALKLGLSSLMKGTGERVFIHTTVGQLLFEGYKDPLIYDVCNNAIINPFCKALGIPDRIGLFYGRNGTADGLYEVNTGSGNPQNIGKVHSFNKRQEASAWYGPYAKMINGTDGQLYQPGFDLRDAKKIQIFVGQICRTIELEYYGTEDYEGVMVYMYKPAANLRDVDLQRKLGFCNPKTPVYFNNTYIQQPGCTPAGIMDISSCLPGRPRIYLSQPHFLGCNPSLRHALSGIRTPTELENTVVGIEPKTGVVVMARQRSQVNLGVTNGNLYILENMTSHIIPIAWLNETATFDIQTKNQLLYMRRAFAVASNVSIVAYCVVTLSLLFLAVHIIRHCRNERQEGTRLIEENNEETVHEIVV